jgi:hypothetical protein
MQGPASIKAVSGDDQSDVRLLPNNAQLLLQQCRALSKRCPVIVKAVSGDYQSSVRLLPNNVHLLSQQCRALSKRCQVIIAAVDTVMKALYGRPL